MHLCKKLSVLFVAAFYSFSVMADDSRNRFGVSVGAGDADFKFDGTLYDGDLSGSGLSALIYIGDDIYATLGRSSSELEIVGVNIDSTVTSYGGGIVFAEGIDLIAGEGEEFRVGFTAYDIELAQGSTTVTDDAVDVVTRYETGLGDGLSLGFYFTTDTDDLFSDNSYDFLLAKSLGSNLIAAAEYGFSKAVVDSQNSTETSSFAFSLAFVF